MLSLAVKLRVSCEAGGKAQDIVFSGVAKSDAEIRYALDVGIGQFNVRVSS